MSHALSIPQALLLLILKNESGTPKTGFHKPVIAGAALSELLLQGLVTLSDEKKPKVIVGANTQSKSPFLNLCLEQLRDSEKPREMAHWIMKLCRHKSSNLTLADELCELGAITRETSKVFGLFDRTVWPEASPKLEADLKQGLEEAMFGNGPVDERKCVIIALSKTAKVLNYNFDRKKLKANKDRIKAITAGDLYAAGATAKAVKAAQTAIIAATSAAVVATTAAN